MNQYIEKIAEMMEKEAGGVSSLAKALNSENRINRIKNLSFGEKRNLLTQGKNHILSVLGTKGKLGHSPLSALAQLKDATIYAASREGIDPKFYAGHMYGQFFSPKTSKKITKKLIRKSIL